MESILSELSSLLGISPSTVATILVVAASIATLLGFYLMTASLLLASLSSCGVLYVGMWLGWVPIWLVVLSGLFVVGNFVVGGVFNERHKPVTVAVLVGIMISIVVGVTLIPTIFEVTEGLAEAEGGGALSALVGALPFVVVAVILLGAVSWLGGSWGGSDEEKEERKEKVIEVVRNAKSLIISIERASKSWNQYINNLDTLLGIKTVVDPNPSNCYGLKLTDKNELVISQAFDWFIADKHPDRELFKVVGLHKEDASMNVVCLLGRNGESEQPYLIPIPVKYIKKSWGRCVKGALRDEESGQVNKKLIGTLT